MIEIVQSRSLARSECIKGIATEANVLLAFALSVTGPSKSKELDEAISDFKI